MKSVKLQGLFSFLFFFLAFEMMFAEVIIPAGSVWKYLDNGTDQGIIWRELEFDDSSWQSGPAQLGYGDGDESTVLSYGNDPNNKYITTYFRHHFSLSDPDQFSYFRVRLLRDDGAVVYLNGVEIVRSNMPDGNITYQTPAAHTVGGSEEDTFFEYIVFVDTILGDENVLAVEVHQRSPTSSDISFDLILETYEGPVYSDPLKKGPYLVYIGDPVSMLVRWQVKYETSCNLEWGPDTNYGLGSAQTSEISADHLHQYLITSLEPGTRYFYRLTVDSVTFCGSFNTPPPDTADRVKFIVYGDTRTYPANHGQVAARVLATIQADSGYQTLICATGDLVSSGDQESCWQDEFFNRSYQNIQTLFTLLPFQSCRGNHEQSGMLFAKYFPYPRIGNGYFWSFDYGPVHFAILDQYVSYSSGSTQLQWLESDLSATQKSWRFILLHEPGWSAGGHSNELPVQTYIQPLCEQYGVQLVLGGHNHYYARAVVNGVQHITTGGGGAPLYDPNPNSPHVLTVRKAYHFCKVFVDGDSLRFYAVDKDGQVFDQFVIGSELISRIIENQTITTNSFTILKAFPNPFNTSLHLTFSLPLDTAPSLLIYNLQGVLVKQIDFGRLNRGTYSYVWNGKDSNGSEVPSGIYIVVIKGDGQLSTKKVALLK